MDPPLCANGCGFYGSDANQNLCSKCYSDLLKAKIIKPTQVLSLNHSERTDIEDSPHSSVPLLESSAARPSLPSACYNENNASAVTVTTSDSEEKTKKKKRCKSCNKRVGLTGFECRCGDTFCGRHRYPEAHACIVNFKEIGRQGLAKLNPMCKSDKLESRI